MKNIDPGADIIQFVGDAALDAAGLGAAAPLWDVFFPQGEPMFSLAQLDQLRNLFEQLFSAQYFQQNLDLFTSAVTLCNEYANNPTPGQLGNILTQTENTAMGLFSNGYTTSRVYMSAALLHVLTLKFALEAADPPHQSGAEANIASAALETLNNLLTLEQAYGTTNGWQEYAAFKQATVMNNGSMSQTAVTAFGANYMEQVQGLMRLISLYDPLRMGEIIHPPYMMLFVPYDSGSTPLTWTALSQYYRNMVFIYKCQSLPPSVPSNYFPLSDLAIIQILPTDPQSPQFVIYVAAHASPLVQPTGYQQIYNDSGSGFSQDYAGYWTTPPGIGSFSGTNDSASQPDYPNLCQLIDSRFYVQVELPAAYWDDSGTGSSEDGTIYQHPQFSEFGIYVIERSHSRPDPDTVNGLSWLALSGHPTFIPPAFKVPLTYRVILANLFYRIKKCVRQMTNTN